MTNKTLIPTQKQRAELDMLHESMRAFAGLDLMVEFEKHIKDRPDINGDDLEEFTNSLRKHAWRLQRGKA